MSESNLVVKEEQKELQASSESAQLMSIIERTTVNPNVDIDKMMRLLDMQERILNRNAEQAFNAALAQMQSDLPSVPKTAKGYNSAMYAPLEKINEAVRPFLQKYCFAVTFRTKQNNNFVEVTAILSHKDGHKESTSLTLPLETSGNKNAVQAIGSTISYGRRYALCALLNISTGDDTDGVRPKCAPLISRDQAQNIRKAISLTGNSEQDFCRASGIGKVDQLEAGRFSVAMEYLKGKAQGAV